jgi:hypothetical protein
MKGIAKKKNKKKIQGKNKALFNEMLGSKDLATCPIDLHSNIISQDESSKTDETLDYYKVFFRYCIIPCLS